MHAALANAVGKAIRADPRTKHEILVGPSTSGMVEADFLHVLFGTGALQYFDAVCVHACLLR